MGSQRVVTLDQLTCFFDSTLFRRSTMLQAMEIRERYLDYSAGHPQEDAEIDD